MIWHIMQSQEKKAIASSKSQKWNASTLLDHDSLWSEINNLEFYINIIVRIELHWWLCQCQLIQLFVRLKIQLSCVLADI